VPQQPDPPRCGHHAVQVLRTYPYRRRGYSFAPEGERSIARAYLKVLSRARSLIYLEDQYLWSRTVAEMLARALVDNGELHLIAVLPRFPDQDGRLSRPPNLVGRAAALHTLRTAGGDRVAVYSPENEAGVPIYVHAKVCVVDDTWAIVGSDNFNRRSWTHDSELSCAVIDEDGAPGDEATSDGAAPFPQALRAARPGSEPASHGRAGPKGATSATTVRSASKYWCARLAVWRRQPNHAHVRSSVPGRRRWR
jgi:phosphatidylserine/phosphatidylglycerophosphate/cardiolipin synthase-like enzyme